MPSRADPAALVTGVTGMTGVDLLAALLGSEELPIRVVIRDGEQQAPVRFAGLLDALRTRGVAASELDRLSFIAGDLNREAFGLDPGTYRELAASTRAILHAAADTGFSLPIEDARLANVGTTRNVVAFARDCSDMARLGSISTAYVAGTREGTIFEGELEPTEFVNTYEQSKFEAELELRAAMADLPIAVYRPSTVFGSSETGAVPKMTAVHRAVELAYRGLIPLVPGEPDSRIELVDLEFVTGAVAFLFGEAFQAGTTYHLTAGPDRSFTLGEFIETTLRILGELDPSWLSRGIEAPPIVDGAVFDMLRSMISTVDDPEAAAVLGALDNFVPQMLHPKEFDTTNADAALPADITPASIRDYFARAIEFCMETDWGRSPVGAVR